MIPLDFPFVKTLTLIFFPGSIKPYEETKQPNYLLCLLFLLTKGLVLFSKNIS